MLVPEPHLKPRRAFPSSLAPAANHLGSSCRPRFSVPAVHLEPQTLHCTCIECRKPIDEDHFKCVLLGGIFLCVLPSSPSGLLLGCGG